MAPVSTVIKVKFGDTLRRFNALIHKKEFNFDMAMLREKICSLFDFTSDVDFTLTYIDEDGDIVTLCDDDDLQDVATQSLDPLRITVSLNTENLGGSSLTSSRSSTPLSSPQDHLPSQFLNSRVLEILKYVPEPLHDGLSKLLLFLASETANSTVVLAELVEKMQTTHLNNKPSESKAGSMSASDIKEQQGLKITGPSKRSPATYLEALTMNEHKVLGDDEDGSADSKNKSVQIETVAKDVKFGDLQPPRSLDLNVPYSGPENFPYLVNSKDVKGSGSRNCGDTASVYDDCRDQLAFEADSVLKSKKDTENISIEVQQKSVGFGASNPDYLKRCLQDSKTTEISGFPWTKAMKATHDSSSSSGWQQGTLGGINECPYKGIPLSSDSTVHPCPYASRVPPFKRSYNHGNGLESIFHMGVRCDGCGVHPITGSHFKSKVKDNYHLCSICFEEMGNDADYIRMHHPMVAHNSSPFNGFQDHFNCASLPVMKPSLSKLDSCFVLDVNVYDGTIMAPSTTFTKIWRMRNNGDVIWPQGSQFLWTGGDWLSKTVSVEVEIPANGLPVDQELDIAVDFVAPELPGQYVSYWRMASPSGQKFGQHVWIYIEVDDGLKDSDKISINLNLLPVKDPEEVVKSGMGHDSELHENHFVGVVEPEDLFLDAEPYRDQVTTYSK